MTNVPSAEASQPSIEPPKEVVTDSTSLMFARGWLRSAVEQGAVTDPMFRGPETSPSTDTQQVRPNISYLAQRFGGLTK